jgi:hypothetical protein
MNTVIAILAFIAFGFAVKAAIKHRKAGGRIGHKLPPKDVPGNFDPKA